MFILMAANLVVDAVLIGCVFFQYQINKSLDERLKLLRATIELIGNDHDL